MKIGKSVKKAIDEWVSDDLESAMLHACNAVDGTARKVYPKLGNRERFTLFLRENYSILGIMGMPGIDICETRFPINIKSPTTKDGKPDIADILYSIHRCSHNHGDEIPDGFELIRHEADKAGYTEVIIGKGKIHLADRIIFAMLATVVFCEKNIYQEIDEGYYLKLGMENIFKIQKWWGRKTDFLIVASTYELPMVKLDFGDWMDH
jgi:hypothetical protein